MRSRGADSVVSFARDTGGLVFKLPPADGAFVRLGKKPGLLDRKHTRVAIGYGAEFHSGDYPLSVTPTSGFHPVYDAYWENTSITFEGGMSGGPVFSVNPNGKRVVAAIVVASSGPPEAGGVRIVDSLTVNMANTYLP